MTMILYTSSHLLPVAKYTQGESKLIRFNDFYGLKFAEKAMQHYVFTLLQHSHTDAAQTVSYFLQRTVLPQTN